MAKKKRKNPTRRRRSSGGGGRRRTYRRGRARRGGFGFALHGRDLLVAAGTAAGIALLQYASADELAKDVKTADQKWGWFRNMPHVASVGRAVTIAAVLGVAAYAFRSKLLLAAAIGATAVGFVQLSRRGFKFYDPKAKADAALVAGDDDDTVGDLVGDDDVALLTAAAA